MSAPIRDACSHCYMGDRCDGSCKLEPYPMRGVLILLTVAAIWHREARNIYASEMDDLRDLVAKCINADIERLEADLAVALASSNRVDAPEVFAAKAAVENAKTILKGIK
jgi:hypothetical protein